MLTGPGFAAFAARRETRPPAAQQPSEDAKNKAPRSQFAGDLETI
jgi:hypothetical protein